jgi:UDP-N-acetylglucosamine enolpyruvyl transferase
MSSNKLKKMNSKKGSVKASGDSSSVGGTENVMIANANENNGDSTSVVGIDNVLLLDSSLVGGTENVMIANANENNGDSTSVVGIDNVLLLDSSSVGGTENVMIANANVNNGDSTSIVDGLDTPLPVVSRREQTPFYAREITLFTDTTCSSYVNLETSGIL